MIINFNQYIKESNEILDDKYQQYQDIISKSLKFDFKLNKFELEQYLKDNEQKLKDCFKKRLNYKQAIKIIQDNENL